MSALMVVMNEAISMGVPTMTVTATVNSGNF